MPNKKQKVDQREAANRALNKYRRLQTLIKKTYQLAEKCDLSLNLLVEYKSLNKIVEHYTHDSVKLSNVSKSLTDADAVDPNLRAKLGLLRIISHNI